MINFITNIIAWFLKNTALMIGIIEALMKLIGGIISITPTKKDDALLEKIDSIFSAIKKGIYTISDFFGKYGKSIK